MKTNILSKQDLIDRGNLLFDIEMANRKRAPLQQFMTNAKTHEFAPPLDLRLDPGHIDMYEVLIKGEIENASEGDDLSYLKSYQEVVKKYRMTG